MSEQPELTPPSSEPPTVVPGGAEARPRTGALEGTLRDATIEAHDRPGGVGGERRHLLVSSPTASSSLYQLPIPGRVTIGRSEEAELRIDHASVSRKHAYIVSDRDSTTIADLGSHNGTFVNGRKISGVVALHANDEITIHQTVLTFTTTSASRPPVLVELPAFHQRVEDEVDRAAHYERSAAILCLALERPVASPHRIERIVAGQLRRIDAAAWSGNGELYVLLAETASEEAVAIATQIRAKLDATQLRIGYAAYPSDGYDVAALLASAQQAASQAEPGGIRGSTRAYQTLMVGSQRVLIAEPLVVRLYALLERLAPTDLPVLITGEIGCGKKLAATAVHLQSKRRASDLLTVDCTAIRDEAAERALFGDDHGTGIASGGQLDRAIGSTVLFDEIGELPLSAQARLLRAIESRRLRAGDARDREAELRIVATSKRDLDADMVAGRFRPELFLLFSGAMLEVPPLRQRPRELALIAQAMLDEACLRGGRSMMAISDGARDRLLAYGWPGNLGELSGVMQVAAAVYPSDVLTAEQIAERLPRRSGPIAAAAPPLEASGPASTGGDEPQRFRPIAEELRELEISRMKSALEAAGGNQTRAAGLLSMPVRTFFEKAKQYQLSPRRKKNES